jgi:hypothetical protein
VAPNLNSMGASKYTPGSLKVVGASVDSIWFNYTLDPEVRAARLPRLEELKLWAQAGKERQRQVPGAAWWISRAGAQPFSYVALFPEVGEVAISGGEGGHLVDARVRLYSHVCWSLATVPDMVARGRELVEAIFGLGAVLGWQVGALDVAADVVGWRPTFWDIGLRRFSCPARWVVEAAEEDGERRLLSARWGKRGSAALQARLYDKLREVREVSHKDWLLDVWRKNGWAEEQGAPLRLEFSLSRELLREVGMNLPEEVDLAALFAYGMRWLQFVDVNAGDGNHGRWKVSPAWAALQAGALQLLGEPQGEVKRWHRPKVSLEGLLAQIEGCLAGVGALVGAEEAADVRAFEAAWAQREEVRRGLSFLDRVADKRDRYLVSRRGLVLEEVAA